MEFLKKHYEKVVLSVVLLGLAGFVASLSAVVQKAKDELDEERKNTESKRKEYRPLDLSGFDVSKGKAVPVIKFGEGHNVVNPVPWQQRPDGTLLKVVTGEEVGPARLDIIDQKPLQLIVSYERPSGSSHIFGIQQDVLLNPALRKRTLYGSLANPKLTAGSVVLLLKDMRPKENPTEWVLQIQDETKEEFVVKDKEPWKRVESYTVDLKYDPENLKFTGKRTNDVVSFGGDDYKIVDITANGIVLLSQSSTRLIPVKRKPAP